MSSGDNAGSFWAWRKKKPFLLKVACALIVAGFVFGYTGGISGNSPCIVAAFALWSLAGAVALSIKS